MKRIVFCLLFVCSCMLAYTQYIVSPEDLLIDDVIPSGISQGKVRYSSDYNFYNNLNTWIPYCNSEPLKNPPITYIEISFHVFLDGNGGNNQYTDTQQGRERLISLLNHVNNIYSGNWGPSDPVAGVVELPNRDTRIRFTLGDNNERIYFYDTSYYNNNYASDYRAFLRNNYPSRANKLNVFFTASHYKGKVIHDNIVITNRGSGYTSPPTITFRPLISEGATATAIIQDGKLMDIKIESEGKYDRYAPPQIEISGGGGSGASAIVTKLAGGATGVTNGALPSLSADNYVVMCHCYEADDWIYGMCLAHELAHNLDLRHTYCGGGSSVICCSGSCVQNCTQNCNNSEYLSDIFGTCPGTCPHIANWGDPDDHNDPDDVKITNNVMGGSCSQHYFSPMQVGQMHRTLALKSTRKYVMRETYSPIALSISHDETWDFNLKLYRDIVIEPDAVLTLASIFDMPYNGTIIVNNGAALLITGTINLHDGNKIIVENGGTIKFSSTSHINIDGSGEIEVSSGGYFCIEQGASVDLADYNSVINLRDGYIVGTNTSLLPSSSCISSPWSYSSTGNGSINRFNQNVYIQNETISVNRYYSGKNIYAGRNVNPAVTQGDVVIEDGTNVIFNVDEEVHMEGGFEIQTTGSMEIK